jgi:segregation and condensation protein A
VSAVVHELELDLDAFEGPFDLLLTLVLRDEVSLAEVDLAEIVAAFVERLAKRASLGRPAPPDADSPPAQPGLRELDLEACGEFLVLIAGLLELKARVLFAEEDDELGDLEPVEAAEELARRLAEYRRFKEAAAWLAERLDGERDRFFRLGPAPLAPPRAESGTAPQDPAWLANALRALAVEPPAVSTTHLALRFPPVAQFLDRWRELLLRRSRVDFDQEVEGLSRVEVAVAFLALLELRKANEVALEQAAPFAPIRISRLEREGREQWNVRFA